MDTILPEGLRNGTPGIFLARVLLIGLRCQRKVEIPGINIPKYFQDGENTKSKFQLTLYHLKIVFSLPNNL